MRRVKFINKNKAQFAATLKKNVNDYFADNSISPKGNWKMIFKAIIMILLYMGPFLSVLLLPMNNWLIFPLSVIMGVGMAGLGMSVMHDAAHGSFSDVNWLNRFFSKSMYSIGGNSFNWKIQHNILHHTFTNIEGMDEDIDPKGILRLNEQTPLKKVHQYQYIYAFFLYCLMTLSRTVNEFRQLNKYNKSGITKQQGSTPEKEMIRLILSKSLYLLIILGLPLIFSIYSWWLILLGFLIMHFVGGIFMSTVFQMAHLVEEASQPVPDEQGCIDNEWAVHELETTANFARKSRLFGWMIGGLNYQIEHHLFPNISHIHYKAISPIVKQTASEFGLRYNENRTFLSAIGSHIRMLKRLGRE
ncbi:MAG TPA: acyl-CoA desaturase [Bacteroidia bacterium]|jgi:linoleoyl-CoA desaturase|nr:acyl-CoA desaturase [Bacteroidia bacterium]